jgi:uncharacterized protein YjbI with pentapeptide repeats
MRICAAQQKKMKQKIARARTLTVLRGLDSSRKASVIQFLHEAGLIDKDRCIINLKGADLRGADLSNADLSSATLDNANLSGANFERAELSGIKKSTIEELEKQATSLKDAIMPDGSKHP